MRDRRNLADARTANATMWREDRETELFSCFLYERHRRDLADARTANATTVWRERELEIERLLSYCLCVRRRRGSCRRPHSKTPLRYGERERERESETERETERETETETERDSPHGGRRERQTDRQRERERETDEHPDRARVGVTLSSSLCVIDTCP
ncbi:MAG TPA: hypothetical protein V6C97_21925 [Oculatellaceae cyanobacterium]